MLGQHRHEGLHPQEHAIDVDVHDPPPAFHGEAFDRPGQVDPGVVDEDVKLAVAALHGIARALPVRFLGDVRLDIARRLPQPAEHFAGQRAVGRIEVGQHHLCPLGQKTLDAGEADAAQAARNEGDLALEPLGTEIAHTPIIPAVVAPSITYSLPETKRASSEASQATSPAISSTPPMRPSGDMPS